MGKGSLIGVIRRKVGNMVGQSNSLANGKDKQVWRAYNPNPRNPKTSRQAIQRSLFVACKNFARMAKPLINHSWQGKKYGTRSVNYFYRSVLSRGGANYPGFFYQPFMSQKFIPQPWPLSTGSLSLPWQISLGGDENLFSCNGWNIGPLQAGESVLQAFLRLNPSFKVGDQLTFIAVRMEGNQISIDSSFTFIYDRLIVDSTSFVLSTPDSIITERGVFMLSSVVLDRLHHSVDATLVEGGVVVAAAVILSRKDGRSWLRSNSIMTLADNIKNAFMNADYINACLASFQGQQADASSDWYLNEAQNAPAQGGGSASQAWSTQTINGVADVLVVGGKIMVADINPAREGYEITLCLMNDAGHGQLVRANSVATVFASDQSYNGMSFATSIEPRVRAQMIEAGIVFNPSTLLA